jgi:hypothetical protein
VRDFLGYLQRNQFLLLHRHQQNYILIQVVLQCLHFDLEEELLKEYFLLHHILFQVQNHQHRRQIHLGLHYHRTLD